MLHHETTQTLSRRAFLQNGTLILTSAAIVPRMLQGDDDVDAKRAEADERVLLRAGLITDLHYADKPPTGTRYYRETLGKLEEAAAEFEKVSLDFVVELGDLIDAADSVDVERRYLKTVNDEFAAISKDRHYVLGNHCVDTLTKAEFLDGVAQERSYYSFERGDFHFVVLDACFRSDGQPYGRKNSKWTDSNIPDSQLEWLAADLKATNKQTIVFAHQRLDVANNHGVKNNVQVRQILESSKHVVAVFQGHSHQNDIKDINGIHYCTLVAMVEGSGAESNGYSVLSLHADGTVRVQGFRKQAAYGWS